MIVLKRNNINFEEWYKSTEYFKFISTQNDKNLKLFGLTSIMSYDEWKKDPLKKYWKIKMGNMNWHHIIPKELTTNNEATNGVLLTTQEHLYAHWLLANEWEQASGSKRFYSHFNILLKSFMLNLSDDDVKAICGISK